MERFLGIQGARVVCYQSLWMENARNVQVVSHNDGLVEARCLAYHLGIEEVVAYEWRVCCYFHGGSFGILEALSLGDYSKRYHLGILLKFEDLTAFHMHVRQGSGGRREFHGTGLAEFQFL